MISSRKARRKSKRETWESWGGTTRKEKICNLRKSSKNYWGGKQREGGTLEGKGNLRRKKRFTDVPAGFSGRTSCEMMIKIIHNKEKKRRKWGIL